MLSLSDALASLRQEDAPQLRSYLECEYPVTIRAFRLVDNDNLRPKRRKGFNLVKREHKKLGFVYYVRYSHEGKTLPSKWNTHTNDLREAERFARDNKSRLVACYRRSRDTGMTCLLEQFYASGSAIHQCERQRNRQLSERCRTEYEAVIRKKFLPFLKTKNVFCFEAVTPGLLNDFQDSLLAAGVTPQTVNNNLKAVRRVFSYLARKGVIGENPCGQVHSIPVRQDDRNTRGCHELEKLTGVFNRNWKDSTSYLLTLLIYTTGMRNGEIRRIRMTDMVCLNGCHCINIPQSKSESGKRLVPLHERVYRKLKAYAEGAPPEDPVFPVHSSAFARANGELAKRLKVSREELKRQRVTFYSGRHFWKTLMNREGLGEDVEEIFMGHKVSADVSKLYNHRDKQGRKHLVKKMKQVFAVLDRHIFGVRK